jgi:hypothetical protein
LLCFWRLASLASGTCQHHFCFVCLKDWHLHGISWFECVFSNEEAKGERMYFSDRITLKGALDQVYTFCERELVHFLSSVRAKRVQNEVEEWGRQQAVAVSQAIHGHVPMVVPSSTPIGVFDAELPALVEELTITSAASLAPLLAFLREAHAILCSAYVFMTLHYAHFDASVHPSVRSSSANKLLVDLNQLEYFVDALDMSLIPQVTVRRSIRTVPQMVETSTYVRKYAKAFAQSLAFFQATELKVTDGKEKRSFLRGSGVAHSCVFFFPHGTPCRAKTTRRIPTRFSLLSTRPQRKPDGDIGPAPQSPSCAAQTFFQLKLYTFFLA